MEEKRRKERKGEKKEKSNLGGKEFIRRKFVDIKWFENWQFGCYSLCVKYAQPKIVKSTKTNNYAKTILSPKREK